MIFFNQDMLFLGFLIYEKISELKAADSNVLPPNCSTNNEEMTKDTEGTFFTEGVNKGCFKTSCFKEVLNLCLGSTRILLKNTDPNSGTKSKENECFN